MHLIFILLLHSSIVLGKGSLESYLNAPADLFKNVDIPKPPKSPFGDILKTDTAVSITGQLLKLTSNKNILQTLFNNFKTIFNKSYDGDDENSLRQGLFKDKLIQIVNHNINARSGQLSFERGINPFSDMTTEEVVANYTGLMDFENDILTNFTAFEMFDPDSPPPMPPLSLSREGRTKRQATADAIDWRTYGVVSSIKYQGRCGSCTLFATTACLESSWHLWKRGPLHDLSEQELIDCIPKDDGHRGCAGNDFASTIRYQVLQGQSLEKDYPYIEKDGECKNLTSVSKATKFYQIRKDEKSLQKAVDDYGPVAVGMHVGDPFVDYESGILDVDCRGELNHALLVIGFGSEDGKDYWLLKNSWGDWWGENGYMKLRRNKNNMCKIASSAYFMTA